MSADLFPFAVWLSGTNQNSIPANDNALRNEVLAKPVISVLDAEPSESDVTDGDLHIVGTSWGGFDSDDVVIYRDGWYGFKPFEGWLKRQLDIGEIIVFAGSSGWVIVPTGGSVPVVTESGTSLTALSGQSGQYTRFTNPGAKTYTFEVAQDYIVGSEYHGRNAGAGPLTIDGDSDFAINPPGGGSLVIPEGGTFSVKIVGADEADLFGLTEPAS